MSALRPFVLRLQQHSLTVAWAWCLAVCGPLAAQDVTVTPPAWIVQRDAPEELPAFKSRPRVDFPTELKATPDVGYVVYRVVLDGKARMLELRPHATLAAYERASQGDHNSFVWTPGKRDGKGVNTATSFAVIFNPATAAQKNADATPRLLEVSLVRLKTPPGAKETDAFPDRVESADLSVDEIGNVIAVKNAPRGLEDAFSIAAKNWRFAPARRGGNPVAAGVRAPFVIVTGDPDTVGAGGKRVPPRVTSQRSPIYPFAMRASNMRGEVVIDFIVDLEGRVRNAYALRSLNPSFDDPAIEAVRQWRFEPGRIGEKPVNTHMQVPVVFTLDDTADGGQGPLRAPSKADLSKLPEQFRYDTPPRPTGTVRPVYPYALLREKKDGKAVVRFMVDPKGRVIQTSIGEATTPELGRALQAAIECFTYEPALKGGRPCSALQGFSQQFNRDESWQLVSDEDLSLLRREEKKPETILTLGDLDARLAPLSLRPPHFPLSVKEDVTRGQAVVEFLVDEDGRVRLPRVISATDEAFGYAAVQGVAAWRFEPPTRGGRPVVLRTRTPINFGETAPSPEKK